MDEYTKETCEEIDAIIFSGDRLHSEKSIMEFKQYLNRWLRESTKIENFLKEERDEL